ncbi:unnamed protein product [[Candida] boidinii]|nr:unnamed protein product [[Candida] boidinii]
MSEKIAQSVLQRSSEYLKSNLVSKQPAWYKVLAYHPPKTDIVKKINTQALRDIKSKEDQLSNPTVSLYKTRIKPSQFKSDILKPQKLKFIEDELRNLFYKQHPWELADPKSIIENDKTIETSNFNWNSIIQLNKKLDGESVVQRSLFLINSKKLNILNAYEQAKFEYYKLKIKDEIENHILKEESEMFGAVYGLSSIEQGFEKESKIIKKWKKDAIEITKVLSAKSSKSDSASALIEDQIKSTEEEDSYTNEDDVYSQLKDEADKL